MSTDQVVLVTAGLDSKVCFWSVPTMIVKKVAKFPGSQVNCLNISSDQSLVVAGGNNRIQLYETRTPNEQPFRTLNGDGGNFTSVNFQKQSKWLFCSQNKTIRIFDCRGKRFACQFPNVASSNINSAQLHPNQVDIIFGDDDGNLRVLDLIKGKVSQEISLKPNSQAFMGGTLASHSAEQQPLARPSVQGNSSVSAASASVVSADSNSKIDSPVDAAVAAVKNGAVQKQPQQKNASKRAHRLFNSTPIRSVSISPNSRTVAAATDKGEVFLWNLNSSKEFVNQSRIRAHNTYCLCVQIAHDNKLMATTSADKMIRLWNISNLNKVKHVESLQGHHRWVWDCAFSADSAYVVSASSDMSARLWSIAKRETILQCKHHEKAVTCVALNDRCIQ